MHVKLLKKLAVGTVSVCALLAPVALSSGASASALIPRSLTDQTVTSHATGNEVDGNGSGKLIDNSAYHYAWDFHYVGIVNNASEYPFTPGSGLNATYAGDYYYYVTEYGASSLCWNMSGNGWIVESGACGSDHPYSLVVSTRNSPDGTSGHGFVNVGASDSAGAGIYMDDLGSGDQLWSSYYAAEKELSFNW
jgi:hypothetical protein